MDRRLYIYWKIEWIWIKQIWFIYIYTPRDAGRLRKRKDPEPSWKAIASKVEADQACAWLETRRRTSKLGCASWYRERDVFYWWCWIHSLILIYLQIHSPFVWRELFRVSFYLVNVNRYGRLTDISVYISKRKQQGTAYKKNSKETLCWQMLSPFTSSIRSLSFTFFFFSIFKYKNLHSSFLSSSSSSFSPSFLPSFLSLYLHIHKPFP